MLSEMAETKPSEVEAGIVPMTIEEISAAGIRLTERQREALRLMRDTDEEMVWENGQVWVGLERFSRSTVVALIRACAVSLDQFSTVGKVERYSINSTGCKLLELAAGTAVTDAAANKED
jgi:hypothetical protein